MNEDEKPDPNRHLRAACATALAHHEFMGAVIPDYMHRGLVAYLIDHVESGAFLMAVLEGDLKEACVRADRTNIQVLHAYVDFLYNQADYRCWGTKKRVQAWLQLGQVKDAAAAVGAAVESGEPMVIGDELHVRVRPPAYPSHIEASIDFGAPIEAGAPIEKGEPVTIGEDGKAYPVPAARTIVHCRRGDTAEVHCGEVARVVTCVSAADLLDYLTVVGSIEEGHNVPCPGCREALERAKPTELPPPAPVIHCLKPRSIQALCGNILGHGVECAQPADYPDEVRKFNPEAVPCERCLEVSRT